MPKGGKNEILMETNFKIEDLSDKIFFSFKKMGVRGESREGCFRVSTDVEKEFTEFSF